MNESLQFTRLAADLLKKIEEILDDDRIGEDNHTKLMGEVLASYGRVEEIIELRKPAELHDTEEALSEDN